MPPKKNKLSYRKNQQSKTHIARARARRERRNIQRASFLDLQEKIPVLLPSTFKTRENDQEVDSNDNFRGFDISPVWKPNMRVLSLFDGIGTALKVLDNLRISVEAYFSFEVDKKAIQVQMFRFGERITKLGSVENLGPSFIDSLGRIDLLIGGSPCSDLSLVNPNRRGLHGKNSTGCLFFKYIDILKYLRERQKTSNTVLYWLYENTSHLENKVLREMNWHLGQSPVMRCASDFLPVKRRRFFWGNLPGLEERKSELPKLTLKDILPSHRKPNVEVVPTLTTSIHSQRTGQSKTLPVIEDGEETTLFITEMEALFGFPVHFTDGPNLTLTDRRRLLGKAFCVPVIQEILSPLTEKFKLLES